MTNPSTGLPEELEKISRLRTVIVAGAGDYDECKSAINSTICDVLDWACKKVCVGCRAGIPVEWFAGHQYVSNFGPVDDVFLHHNEDGYADCAASVLREGK